MIVHENLAQVQMNSVWACDEENYRVLVCGDLGRAILLDCRMGADGPSQRSFENQQAALQKFGKSQDAQVKFKVQIYHKSEMRNDKWKTVKGWFKAHIISKRDPNYVNSVKYSHTAKIYVTGTSSGQVNLWDNQVCMPLGTLNSCEFSIPRINQYLNNEAEIRTESQELLKP